MPDGCKAQIDPVQFGEVKEKADGAHKRVDGIDSKLEVIDQKIDKIKWYILLGIVASPFVTSMAPEAKDILVAMIQSFGSLIQITYAHL